MNIPASYTRSICFSGLEQIFYLGVYFFCFRKSQNLFGFKAEHIGDYIGRKVMTALL